MSSKLFGLTFLSWDHKLIALQGQGQGEKQQQLQDHLPSERTVEEAAQTLVVADDGSRDMTYESNPCWICASAIVP